MFNKLTKLFVTITLLYQTPVYSKSASFNEFNSKDLSNYFSGIVASENNNNSDIDKLSVKTIIVNQGMRLKRMKPRARGRADRIIKPTSCCCNTRGSYGRCSWRP